MFGINLPSFNLPGVLLLQMYVLVTDFINNPALVQNRKFDRVFKYRYYSFKLLEKCHYNHANIVTYLTSLE